MRASTAVSTMERPLRVTLLITFSKVSSLYTRSNSYGNKAHITEEQKTESEYTMRFLGFLAWFGIFCLLQNIRCLCKIVLFFELLGPTWKENIEKHLDTQTDALKSRPEALGNSSQQFNDNIVKTPKKEISRRIWPWRHHDCSLMRKTKIGGVHGLL